VNPYLSPGFSPGDFLSLNVRFFCREADMNPHATFESLYWTTTHPVEGSPEGEMRLSNHRFKWISGTLAAGVASALLAFPTAAGAQTGKINLEDEILNARKQQILRQIGQVGQEVKEHRSASRKTSGMAAQAVESARFEGHLGAGEVHYYWFETEASGTISIRAGQTGEQAGYSIVPVNGDGTEDFRNGETIPAGQYFFVVYSDTETSVDYWFEMSGLPLAYAPDTTLPNLTVTKPSAPVTRLSVGDTQAEVAGSHDGVATTVFHETGETDLQSNSFAVQVPVRVGENEIGVLAVESSGNAVSKDFLVVVPGTMRIAGANRYEVSAKISREIYPNGYPYGVEGTVIIARGDLYTDALSGGALAGLEGAPILLSDYKTQSLPGPVQDEIRRLKPVKAIILGGTGSVSSNVENQLLNLGIRIERIAGTNRFDVSARIAHRVLESMGGENSGMDTAIVASGTVFPDALSASSPSGIYNLPILQVTKDSLPKEIDAFIRNHPYIRNFIIVGGPGTVSDGVKAKLDSYANSRGGLVDRISGANRYEVSVNVAKYFAFYPTFHVFAKGTDFPDALSGGPLASSVGGPILLTPPTKVESSTAAYLNGTEGKDFYYILGGTGSISSEVENQLRSTLN
jgi:putative cell wall-binding protein